MDDVRIAAPINHRDHVSNLIAIFSVKFESSSKSAPKIEGTLAQRL